MSHLTATNTAILVLLGIEVGRGARHLLNRLARWHSERRERTGPVQVQEELIRQAHRTQLDHIGNVTKIGLLHQAGLLDDHCGHSGDAA